jgi:hypothetical protein
MSPHGTTKVNGSSKIPTESLFIELAIIGSSTTTHSRGNSRYSIDAQLLHHKPTINAKALVKRHRTSLKCLDEIKIIRKLIRESHFT